MIDTFTNKTFEVFLQEICFEINPEVLDDDMPDFFDNWISNLDVEKTMEWAGMYGRQQFLAGRVTHLMQ